MSKAKTNNMIKRTVDAAMTVLLLLLMAYQVTGEVLHEWIGIGMTVLVIFHQILNRKWYGALFKGRYNAYRMLTAAVNILLLCSFAMTAFCGMSMSGHAVPFLYGMAPVSFARQMHLSLSHWAFVLMGLHLGLHIPAMAAGLKLKDRTRTVLACIFTCIGGFGLWLFLRSGMPDYLFFRVPFAFLDYEKAGGLVFLENLLMLSFWAGSGTQAALICMNTVRKDEKKKNPLVPAAAIMAAVIIGTVLMLLFPSADGQVSPGSASAEESAPVNDGFVLIQGGSFLMGSPDTENWRIDDETQHEVFVSSFFMDPYETTQGDYIRLVGENPSTFTGDDLPAENISWLDAVRYANAKSTDAGLTPVYSITADGVAWDLSAAGYSVHYSGGSALSDDVTSWLQKNGITR